MKYEESCGAVVFTRRNNETYYVIIKSNEGFYGFPKGHMKKGETELETAKREINEEVGIKPNFIDGFSSVTEYYLPNKKNILKKVVYFLAEFSEQKIKYQPEEISGVYLMTFGQAIEAFQFGNLKEILKEAKKVIDSKYTNDEVHLTYDEYFDVLNPQGEYTNEKASRFRCHQAGLWHKAVVLFIISEDNSKVLLQRRSSKKKLWPNLWDITSGGHVLAGELGYQAVIRETKEEIGIDIPKESLEFIGATTSENIQGEIINRHYNEYYVAHKDIDLSEITLQDDEVEDIGWFTKDEILTKVKDNYNSLTYKVGCWNYLIKYFELTK